MSSTRYIGDDGIIFGANCERRVFFPTSNNLNHAEALDVDAALVRAASTGPLSALGLIPASPYIVLKRSASVPEKSQGRGAVSPCRQQQSPTQQRAITVSQQQQSASTTREHVANNPPRDDGTLRPAFEHIYSPQRLPRAGTSRRRRRRDNGKENPICDVLGKDHAAPFLLQRMREDEMATMREAAKLRREADPGALIRRFLRCSG